ncbi:hypothetical protein Tco_0388050, partial [Tanacetum coccineum]
MALQNLQIQSSQPLDEAWGIVGLPNGIRVLVEEEETFIHGVVWVAG